MSKLFKFKFCPNCKTKTEISDRLIDCKFCGFHYYFNPAVTNGVILENSKGELLLVKRKYPPKKSCWDIAGGFVDFAETLEDSLKREIKEELGIEIKNLSYFMSTVDRYLFKGINYHTLCFIFIGKVADEKIVPTDDITEVRFFKKEKIPFARIAFAGVKKAIKKYLSSSFH